MKIILAIIQDKDSNRLSNELIDANIRATKLSSTGGFLKAGNSTFIVGIEDDRVEEALEIIKKRVNQESNLYLHLLHWIFRWMGRPLSSRSRSRRCHSLRLTC